MLGALVVPLFAQADPQPIPSDKRAYIGEWKGKDMELNIAASGKLHYKRKQPGKNLDLNVDMLGFNGDNFDVGVGIIRSTFVVSKPPHQDDKKMKMTVDGVELTKAE
ncbi:hypothetical protein GEV02_14415 [Rugamonas sp. FT29W]|uniref:Uncharacterized protein n=1 Tax=Rugamonas aquatica TaxID=2743357 RepID=A0A6A7N2V8_9BURK|nr:hypothetical protein [Rugamonas aquatica]